VNFTDCNITVPSFPLMVKQTEGYTFLHLRCWHIPQATWGHPVQTDIALLYSTHQSYVKQDISNQYSHKMFTHFNLLTVQHYNWCWTPRFCLTSVYHSLPPFHILPLIQHNTVFQINFCKTLLSINREHPFYYIPEHSCFITKEASIQLCKHLEDLLWNNQNCRVKISSQFCQMWTS